MINLIHDALARILCRHGRIPIQDVDITFEIPTAEWLSSLDRPAVNLFLFDLRENTDLRRSSPQVTRGDNHTFARRVAPRRVDLHYLVSAVARVSADEHQLLWRAMAALMKYQEFEKEDLPEQLREVTPPLTARIDEKESSHTFLEYWNALDIPPRPAIHYIVTAPLDLDLATSGPLVLAQITRYKHLEAPQAVAGHVRIGGTVRSREGQPIHGVRVSVADRAGEGCLTDTAGRFILSGVETGPVTLRVSEPTGMPVTEVVIDVPNSTCDITLDR